MRRIRRPLQTQAFAAAVGLALAACQSLDKAPPEENYDSLGGDEGLDAGGAGSTDPTADAGGDSGAASWGSEDEADGEAGAEAGDGDGDGDSTQDSGGEATSSNFIPVGDVGELGYTPCDPLEQDCGEGQKCVPFAFAEPYFDAFGCTPVQGDKGLGEACTLTVDGPTPGTDDCDAEHTCYYAWDYGDTPPVSKKGHCLAMCSGTYDALSCDEGQHCVVFGAGTPLVCDIGCDPLLKNCPEGMGCHNAGWGYACTPSGGGQSGEGCLSNEECASGNTCWIDPQAPGCTNTACCAQYCDLESLDNLCPPGGECVALDGGVEPVPPGFENVGLCLSPAP